MRRRLALSLLAAWTLLAAVPALARADLGHQAVFHAAATPTDAYWRYEWGLESNDSTLVAHHTDADIDAQQAWDDGYDGTGATVAVVDTRIDATNADIAPRLSQTTGAGPDVANFAGCAPDAPPDHGTAVAGVVAAARDNNMDAQGFSQGITGVAPGAEIVPVPALDDCGDGTVDSVKAGFQYAVDHHIPIVVASFATDPLLSQHDTAAIAADFDQFFNDHLDTLFVVAAGNEGADVDPGANPVYPCSSDAPNVVCVGASAADDSPSCESNVGASSVDLFAPGERIYSDFWSAGRQYPVVKPLSGTSMAAPMVAGVAALVAPSLATGDALGLADALRDGADPRDAMQGISAAQGRLNAVGALAEAGVTPAPSRDGGELSPRTSDGSPWVSCDADHDGVRTESCVATPGRAGSCDNCPDAANPDQADADGDGIGDACDPDVDGDGVANASDNCVRVANASQANTDGDAFGDACDPDIDGDGVLNGRDACPYQYYATSTGCAVYSPPAATPAPPPPPVVTPTPTPTVVTPVVPLRIVSVAVNVAHNRQTARVTVRLTRTAGTSVTVERRVKRHWTRVTRRAFSATAAGRAMTVPTSRRGTYRVTVVLAGAKTVRRHFRV